MFGFHFLKNIEHNKYFKYRESIYRRVNTKGIGNKVLAIRLESIDNGEVVQLSPFCIVKEMDSIKALSELSE